MGFKYKFLRIRSQAFALEWGNYQDSWAILPVISINVYTDKHSDYILGIHGSFLKGRASCKLLRGVKL